MEIIMTIKFDKQYVTTIFKAAGFEVREVLVLMNQYWPRNEHYYKLIVENPWFLVYTQYGPIIVGPRKRVWSLEWRLITESFKLYDEDPGRTSELGYIHSYTLESLVGDLFALNKKITSWQKGKYNDNT